MYDNLIFGFMPSFEDDFFGEILFAKKHFDFVEITLDKDLEIYSTDFVQKIQERLLGFPVLGHIHWEYELLENGVTNQKIIKSIDIFEKLGCKKITIHPSSIFSMYKNINAIKHYNDYCLAKDILLCVENVEKGDFRGANIFEMMFDKLPEIGVTLDTGHALLIGRNELDKFFGLAKNLEHIHLHDARNGHDHLGFIKETDLKGILNQIQNLGKKTTVTLEIFFELNEKNRIPINGEKRKEVLLKQMGIIKSP